MRKKYVGLAIIGLNACTPIVGPLRGPDSAGADPGDSAGLEVQVDDAAVDGGTAGSDTGAYDAVGSDDSSMSMDTIEETNLADPLTPQDDAVLADTTADAATAEPSMDATAMDASVGDGQGGLDADTPTPQDVKGDGSTTVDVKPSVDTATPADGKGGQAGDATSGDGVAADAK